MINKQFRIEWLGFSLEWRTGIFSDSPTAELFLGVPFLFITITKSWTDISIRNYQLFYHLPQITRQG